MRQRMENDLSVTVEGVDLTTVTGLVFWVRQEKVFLEYVPEEIVQMSVGRLLKEAGYDPA